MKRSLALILSLVLIFSCIGIPAIAAEASPISNMTALFTKPEGNFYNYAPCMVQIDENTKYVYYCANQSSGEIIDYICWRKATRQGNSWVWSNENVAFGPSTGTWDECHVCDPDIVKGAFKYNGHEYTWAMTYLGVAQWDCNANQIGIAFADSIEGPWVKFDQNPIIGYTNTTTWGTGQDSMVSLDMNGRFRIIYRDSDGVDDYCRYKDFDFSGAEAYTATEPTTVTRNGLTDGISHTCSSHVVYDPVKELYYMAAEHVWDESKRCCRETLIANLDKTNFESGTGTWDIVYRFNQGNTGYAGNHNASIARDAYGRLWDSNRLPVVMSSSTEEGLWSFKLNEATLDVSTLHSSTQFQNGHAYKLVNKETGYVLDNWSTDNGSACYAYEWTGAENQQWIFINRGGNNYKLLNRWTGKALDNYANDTPQIVYVWDDVASMDQNWEITPISDTYYKLTNISTGLSLTNIVAQNGAEVTAQTYDGSDRQLWEIVDLGLAYQYTQTISPGKTYQIINSATGDVLDNWNSENGTTCYSYNWTGVDNQKWIVNSTDTENTFSVINKWTHKALDNYDSVNGSVAYVWDYVQGIDQHWQIVSIGDGCFKIVNQKTQKALTQSIQGNGNAIFCWDYNNVPSQIWHFVEIE